MDQKKYDDLDERFGEKVRSNEQLLYEQSGYADLFKRFGNLKETEKDALEWGVVCEDDNKSYYKKYGHDFDEFWTEGALKDFVVEEEEENDEPFINTVELMRLPAKKQKMEIEKVVNDKPWLAKAMKGYQKREKAAIELKLDFFIFEESEETTEEKQSDQIELKDNCVKLTSTSTRKFSSRKRLASTFTASASSSSSSAPSIKTANPLGVSQLKNILNGHTLQFSADVQKQLQASSSSMNINQSIQINFVLGNDTAGVGELLKGIQFDGEAMKSHFNGIKDRVMANKRLQELEAPAAQVKQEPVETIDLVETDEDSRTSEMSTQTQDDFAEPNEAPQPLSQALDDEESDISDDEDFLDHPRTALRRQLNISRACTGNSTSNLTLPLANFKFNDTADTSTLAGPPTVSRFSTLTPAERFKTIFEDSD